MTDETPNRYSEAPTAVAPLPVLAGNPPPAKPELIDQGFCLLYYRLSYRRRFWRDIFFTPLTLILPFLPFSAVSYLERVLLFALMVAITVGSAWYNYDQWQKTKQVAQSR